MQNNIFDNICYFNASMQCFVRIVAKFFNEEELKKLIIIDDVQYLEEKKNDSHDKQLYTFVNSVLEMIHYEIYSEKQTGKRYRYIKSETNVIEIQNIKSFLYDCYKFDGSKQHDAEEFLTKFLNSLSGIKKLSHLTNKFKSLFIGNNDDGSVNSIPEDGLIHKIKFPDENESYSVQVLILKEIHRFVTYPDILIIHLLRFKFDGKKSHKILNKCKANDYLYIPSIENDSSSKSIKVNYRLESYIYHKGLNANSGHYKAYIRDNNEWFCFNDGLFGPYTALAEQSTADYGYIYFYEKI